MKHVKLNEAEMKLAKYLGNAREEMNKSTTDMKVGNQDSLSTNIEAVGAELAVCKYLNLYPDTDTSSWAVADCVFHGFTIDVKWSKSHRSNLVAKKKPANKTCNMYVQVTGEMPNYKINGYCSAKQLFSERQKTDLGYGETYLVLNSELKDIENLIKYKQSS
jgi:hypothetical protein